MALPFCLKEWHYCDEWDNTDRQHVGSLAQLLSGNVTGMHWLLSVIQDEEKWNKL